MKRLSLAEIQNEIERGLRFAIAVFLVLTWAIIFLIPQEFIYAQSISILQGMKSSSGISEKSEPFDLGTGVPSELNLDRDPLQKSLVDSRSELVLRKLNVFSLALINQNIKGLAGIKPDEFMGSYLAAIGVDLFSWLENHHYEEGSSNIFKIKGPWVLMLVAMSPTSMHEYVGDLDLPSTAGEILEANQFSSNLIVECQGKNVIVAVQGAEGLWIVFCINEKNQVSVV